MPKERTAVVRDTSAQQSISERFDVPEVLRITLQIHYAYLDDTVHETEVGSSEIRQRLECGLTHFKENMKEEPVR